ncbi:dihydrolipoamide dehydrogenase [Pseudalgibacter alginicilyticus]|uniref:Dihydrolipoamide dehydrogenase n=1 Tax=Pseudalgibacter alginicilyticus TaxID=1736674 RepID=A0A0P0D0P4_9FLAO|nr:DUF2911 domain-containing protein [Pseudalgibacter alginicilyticus]ALJ06522.1 dihydrolipoamide dehydrogenase [Pseudalgibacter alginicilyticus]
MKKILFMAMVFTFSLNVTAQVTTPQPSPFGKLEQKVGLTDVSIEYSRPSMRGRTIFGDLVSYGKLWRTGANKNTIITFSDDVVIEGHTLKAGAYSIFTTPNETSWDVVFYTDIENWGTPQKWDNSKVAVKTTVKSYPIPFDVETLTMDVNSISNNGAKLEIFWEKTYVAIPFEVPTDKIVSKSIEKAMKGTSAEDYYAAAVYYLEEGKDIKKAQEWMEKAMSMIENPAFYQLRKLALIYAEAGNKKAAIEAAKKSLEGSEKVGNADYIKMNKASLKEWGAL